MARDSSKNTGNYVSLGLNQIAALINGAAVVSAAIMAQADTLTLANNQNRMFNVPTEDGVTGLMFGTDATSHLRCGARSGRLDAFQTKDSTTAIDTAGGWTHLGGVFNFAGDTITPYLNGVAEGGGAVTFGQSAWTNGTSHAFEQEAIGSFFPSTGAPPASTNAQFDGRLAEWAIWLVDIGAANFAALAKGISPLLIRPDALVLYFRLLGNDSPERDVVSGLSATITGTVAKADHPRMFYPTGGQMWSIPAPAAGRTTKNTRAFPLGIEVGMNWRGAA